MSFALIKADARGEHCTHFLREAVAYCADPGLRIDRVMTDNGSGYISKAFKAACKKLDLRQVRTRPYTPKTNGKAERFVQSGLRDWADSRPHAIPLHARPPSNPSCTATTGIGLTRR